MSDESIQPNIAAPGRRLLLVGRSDAERALRARADVELLRVRTGTDAIGELAMAQDENAPIDLVLVGDGVVSEEERGGFEFALRATDARARILDISNQDESSVLRMISSPASSKPAGAPTPTAAPRDDGGNDAETCIGALLAGHDPTDAFLGTARSALGDASLRFELTMDREATTKPGRFTAPVTRREATFGRLVSDRTPEAELERLAAEFANWLALHEQQRQLRMAAFTDQLTGAWNRRYFDYFITRAIDAARARRHDVTLMVYDIDDFKTYNDKYGHSAGDEVLRETVRLLLSVIRPTDRVCRIGGDEFAVIFDDPTGPREGAGHHPTSIAGITARFQRQICDHRFPKLSEEAPGTLTISGGMATFPWDGGTADELLQRADQLALQSKRQGKNLITFGPGAQRVCGAAGPHGNPPEDDA